MQGNSCIITEQTTISLIDLHAMLSPRPLSEQLEALNTETGYLLPMVILDHDCFTTLQYIRF